jgi:rod shape-determining protein MreC
MLKRLYDITLLFREYVVLAACLATSILLLAFSDSPQLRVIRSYTVVGVGLLQDAVSVVPRAVATRRDIEALRSMNLALTDEVSRLREAKLENLRLRALLGLRERADRRYIAASVVGKSLLLLRNTITIDAGAAEGVRPNMPIVTESGLVGRVTATGTEYAIGQILFNRELRVSAKVQRSRVDGIIRWNGGPTLQLTGVARMLDVRPGDLVITSEYSAFYPEGMKIGVVASALPIPGTLYQQVEVTPAVDFTRLEEVFVADQLPDSSRVVLESHTP